MTNAAAQCETTAARAVFILSSPHSGSTWVGYVLGSTPRSAFLGEYSRAWDEQNRVPCTICAARGLPACEVLHDIEASPDDEAFILAAERTKKPVLIDNSKQIEWAGKFASCGHLDVRVVHVVKDPRSWLASMRRRHGWTVADGMQYWCKQNLDFQAFAAAAAGRGITVCYDLLASAPRRRFKRLFGFCGLSFSDAALRYWNVEHHGFAANGASDAMIKQAGLSSVPSHFATADDRFYEQNSKRLFHDDRWRTELTSDEDEAIRQDPSVRDLLASLGYRLTRSGIAPLRWWSRLELAGA